MIYLVSLALIGLLAWQQHHHHKERQKLLDRIQAPETVLQDREPAELDLVPAVNPEDDNDYWRAQGVEPTQD